MVKFIINFVSPLFYNVLYMSIIGIFVGVFILILRKILDKKISPKWKCIIWSLLLISLVIPLKYNVSTNSEFDSLSISGLVAPIKDIGYSEIIDTGEIINNQENQNESKENNPQILENTSTEIDVKYYITNLVIPFIWIIGIITNLGILLLGNKNIKAKIKGKQYIDVELTNIMQECKEILGVHTNIQLILQDFKKTPSLIGIFRPKILITTNFLKQDYKTKKYIIMHELSHYKRKDLISNYITLLITTIHWFNPFIWIFFKEIRQDIELAADENVLKKLEKTEKKEYGKTLINSLEIFQEEPYTAKLLCVTDDNKNIERRVNMIKLSEKFSENKILISLISVIIIALGITLFFTQNSNIQKSQNSENLINNEEIKKYEYKAFNPSFENNYDFTQDMIYKDSIYYKKINNYEEYTTIKNRWNDIIEMKETDFENNFMVITAIENTSMLELTIDKVETDNNNLYISLIKYEDGQTHDKNETCISLKISREMERENIYATRNLRNSEKDMSNEMQVADELELLKSEKFSYQYKTEEYRNLDNKIKNTNNSSMSVVPQDWKDMKYKHFTIKKDTPEINFSNWSDLGNGFYSLAVTDYSEYLKLINNYDAPELKWIEFKYIYAIIIVRANSDNDITIDDTIKTDDDGNSYFSVGLGGMLDVSEEFKYPAICAVVPNYRSLSDNFLNVKNVD